jgi:tripartite-type tricarboxylate transporter receptor subunit TctC
VQAVYHDFTGDGMATSTAFLRLACIAAALSAIAPTLAQTLDGGGAYPNRPVRIIVPFAAGGGPDIRARQLGQKLSEQWGQPVVIENRAGAGGQIGMQHAAGAAPDGYTLVMAGQSALAIQPHLTKQPFDPLKDFVPVAVTGKGTVVLVVNPQVPASSVTELVQLAKRQPGKLNATSWGTATLPHLALELFERAAAVDITHAPYKDAAAALKDLVAGEVQLTFEFMPPLGPHLKAGRLRALAVTGRARLSMLPDVPTFSEMGLQEMEGVSGWQSVAVPAGTPSEIVDKINQAIVRALALPEIRTSYLEAGFDPGGDSVAEAAAFVRAEHARWGKLITAAAIRAD